MVAGVATPPDSVHVSDESSDEWQLLDDSSDDEEGDTQAGGPRIGRHDLITAPIITKDVFNLLASKADEAPTQYGVLGKTLGIHDNGEVTVPSDLRLYINTNAPFSAVICGVQGAGKSHTLSTILESMFIPNFSPIGNLKKPLAGLVLHYGEAGSGSLPNETAWLCSSVSSHVQGPPIKVYVSHSSLNTMRTVYAPLGEKLSVEPLYFRRRELDAAAILSMMSISSSESAPLYMQVILSILRDMGETYEFKGFIARLEEHKQKFNPAQLAGLEQRMALLMSFLEPEDVRKRSTKTKVRFAAGQLTIVDLSDPFLDEGAACGIFDIMTRLFVRAEVNTGKVLVVDEAHKYLMPGKASSGLTKSLMRLIRQQRHLSMRVLISTQEPTVVPPVLLDLCSVTILHRFTSPSWWQHLIQHVSADFSKSDAFDQVVRLQTGQAMILAPSGLSVISRPSVTPDNSKSTDKKGKSKDTSAIFKEPTVAHLGRRYIIMKTRRRVTTDGGASLLAVGYDR
ncbi:hypothetical protein FA15DRAFT_610541 [Coprinopsis marcescibilis]|uniref:Zona occludens toxin N-terminal domain-containing protein n=1 Tax=Coprinopsis marcescibilis TaxID=230819 RepID=A0A5C3L8J5_COPMA|nr:hypothetical protein FA15DRAFT_610541 [Coprinopsis marcescibilis]